MNAMSNGHAVRELRIKCKVQQKDLAAYLNVTHQKMCAWELGRQAMPGAVHREAIEALEYGAVPKSSSKLSVIGRKDADAGDAIMALFDDAVAGMKDGTLPDVTDLIDDEVPRASVPFSHDRGATIARLRSLTGASAASSNAAYEYVAAAVARGLCACGVVHGPLGTAEVVADGASINAAHEIAAIERTAREMQDAEWGRLASMSSAAERLGWRASMTVVDSNAEYVIETDGCHIMVAPGDVEAFMRGAAWALGK